MFARNFRANLRDEELTHDEAKDQPDSALAILKFCKFYQMPLDPAQKAVLKREDDSVCTFEGVLEFLNNTGTNRTFFYEDISPLMT